MAYACDEERKAHDRERKRLAYIYGVTLLRRFKTIKGCACCGYTGHHAAMEYNHIDRDNKLFNVHEKAHWAVFSRTAPSKIKLKQELSKCEVLCRNCHGIHTFENEHWKKREGHDR